MSIRVSVWGTAIDCLADDRAKIARLTDQFIQNGGEITKLDTGSRQVDDSSWRQRMDRLRESGVVFEDRATGKTARELTRRERWPE